MTISHHSHTFRDITKATLAAQTAYQTHVGLLRQADQQGEARLSAAEVNANDLRRWAGGQFDLVATAVGAGASRLPVEVDVSYAAMPPTSPVANPRLGLETAAQNAQQSLAGLQDGGRLLLLWKARRASIMSGLGVAALVLLVVAGLFISGRFIRDQAIGAEATREITATLEEVIITTTELPAVEVTDNSQIAHGSTVASPVVIVEGTEAIASAEAPTLEPAIEEVGQIVFQSNRDGDYEIYIMNSDGTDTRPITDNNVDDRFPRVSPDGQQVVFQSRRNNNSDIYVINLDGSNERRLTTDGTLDELPSWSPDGQTIIFNSWLGNNSELFTVGVDGIGLRRLTDSSLDEAHASWGRGGRIAFNGTVAGESFFQVYTANPDMSDQRKITNSRVDEYSPEWSPDGRKILFISERDHSTNPGLYIMDEDGSDGQILYNDRYEEWGGTFSPDGSRIVFTIDQPDGTADIYMIDAAGGEPWLVSERGGYPHWVPNGSSPTGSGLPPATTNSEVVVEATVSRTYTGVIVSDGQRVLIEVLDGEWRPGPAPAWPMVSANGDSRVPSNSDFPVSNRPLMTLIAGLGGGTPFAVGDRLELVANESGELWLGPNDEDPTDNAGNLRVRVTLGDPSSQVRFSNSHTLASAPISLSGEGLVRLTFGGTSHYTAMFSPDQSRLLLSVEMDDDWQVFEADPNGGGLLRQITAGPYNHYQAEYSSDGQTFITSVNLDGDGDIYLFDVATGEPQQQLINNPGLDYHPRFLPDGSGFIFSSDTDGDHEVYVGTFDGNQRKLTDNDTFDGFATISPDGQWVTFYSGRDSDYEIYVMDIEGRNARRLTTSRGRDASPSFSPDGEWIVFESDRTGNYEIYAVPFAGGEARRLTNSDGGSWVPVISPDGRWLLFQSDRGGDMDIYRQPWTEGSPP